MEQVNQQDKERRIALKVFVSSVVFLALLFALSMIEGLLRERKARQREAINEISASWGKEQRFSGPVFAVPYRTPTPENNNQGGNAALSYAILPASDLRVRAQLAPELRSRGIYEAVLYEADVTLSGRFITNSLQSLGIASENVDWNSAFVILNLSDPKRLIGVPNLTVNNTALEFKTASPDRTVCGDLFSESANVTAGLTEIPFSIQFRVRGSENFVVEPLASTVTVELSSSWKDPSFIGAMLPSSREISQDGFSALWELSSYQTALPRAWLSSQQEKFTKRANEAAVGVRLFAAADGYLSTERALKHGVLIVSLVLAAFLLFELIVAVEIHPIQYGLVGASLTLFYLTLLSITEIHSFGVGFGIAATVSTTMITLYAKAVLGTVRRAATVAAMLGATYGFLYVVLTLEDLSLLVGTMGLTIAVGGIMYTTRNLNYRQPREKLAPHEAVA